MFLQLGVTHSLAGSNRSHFNGWRVRCRPGFQSFHWSFFVNTSLFCQVLMDDGWWSSWWNRCRWHVFYLSHMVAFDCISIWSHSRTVGFHCILTCIFWLWQPKTCTATLLWSFVVSSMSKRSADGGSSSAPQPRYLRIDETDELITKESLGCLLVAVALIDGIHWCFSC